MWSKIMRANPLAKFRKSRFRQKFHLDVEDVKFISKLGAAELKRQTLNILNAKVKYKLWNDGKQTPYDSHPVFKAMHATACCCRSCIEKWWHIPEKKALDSNEISYLASIIELWIRKELIQLNRVNEAAIA